MFRELYNLHSTLIASNDNISMPVDKIMIWAKTSFHLFEERRFLYENVLEEEWPKMSLLWMEYETEFEHLVENGDHAQYHPDDGRNHSGREQTGRRKPFWGDSSDRTR